MGYISSDWFAEDDRLQNEHNQKQEELHHAYDAFKKNEISEADVKTAFYNERALWEKWQAHKDKFSRSSS